MLIKCNYNRYFNLVLNSLIELHTSIVTLPVNECPYEVERNKKFYPYFKDVLGAIDGTHIFAHVPAEDLGPFRNRKGQITQNVMAACTFDLQFCYVLAGWEGSAHDGKVLNDALDKGFIIPDGKYYLCDAGYGLRKGCLTPYRGVRYHLREQYQSRYRYVFF
jgi:DDE superfamily endonuclease